MNNQYTQEIKELMKDFIQHYFENEKELELLTQIKPYSLIPLNPFLMSYVFDKILGFDVKYRIWEKLNYVISFKYKETFGRVEEHKLSYRLYLDEKYKEEILDIFSKVHILLEKALLHYSEEALTKNSYFLPNYYNAYIDKLCLIETNIEKINKTIINSNKKHENNKKKLIATGTAYEHIYIDIGGNAKRIETPLGRLESKHHLKEQDYLQELSYTVELYIDNWFSFIEHFLSLLFPMTNKYNISEEYSKYLSADWRTKIEKLVGVGNSYSVIVERLSKIKEVYRNRLAHGMFSREKKVVVQIADFGNYPLWVGKKHCRGFEGTKNILNYEDYINIKKAFDDFYEKLELEFALQFNIIKASISTFLDPSLYKKAFDSSEQNEEFIEYYWHIQDMQSNMDW